MKKYILSLFLYLVLIILPIGLIALVAFVVPSDGIKIGGLVIKKLYCFAAAFGLLAIGLLMRKPLRKMRVEARRNTEYDEYGNSKATEYEYLDKAERRKIDMQRTADAERVLSTTMIKKMTKPGSLNPEEEMNALIGLEPVKQKMKEMVARMDFEAADAKRKGKKKKDNTTDGSASGRHMVFYGNPGTGKAQPLYSKVLTPSGFVSMGSIKVGDKIIAGNGNVAEVEGVFPQGKKDIYELTFNDDTKVRCSDEHLWVVQNKEDRENGTYQTIELNQIKENFQPNVFSIDAVKPVEFEEKELKIDPFLLGIILKNGFVQRNVFFDEKFEEKAHKYGYDNIDTAGIIDGLSYYGLKGKHVAEQFIPSPYLYGSIRQRTELLKGLLCTVNIPNNEFFEFGTISEKLKDDVLELVHSLGGRPLCRLRHFKKMQKKVSIPALLYYNIILQIPDCESKCFIRDIKYIGQENCQCIYISDECHTYITDNYIITHNTTVARILTGFLYKYKYIEKNQCIEVDGNFLVAGEQTALKTELLIRNSIGGVLFIDEAYALMGSYSGQEAIATIIKQMEDNRGKFILILAGYTKEMQQLLNANPGFSSRIKEYLSFPDYSIYELGQIFMLMAKAQGFSVSADAFPAFKERIENEIASGNFGNGRTARNVLDESIDRHALNYYEKTIPESSKYIIMPIDISPVPKNSETM